MPHSKFLRTYAETLLVDGIMKTLYRRVPIFSSSADIKPKTGCPVLCAIPQPLFLQPQTLLWFQNLL